MTIIQSSYYFKDENTGTILTLSNSYYLQIIIQRLTLMTTTPYEPKYVWDCKFTEDCKNREGYKILKKSLFFIYFEFLPPTEIKTGATQMSNCSLMRER